MDAEQLVVIQTYGSFEEAKLAESVLVAEGMPCELYDEYMLGGREVTVAAAGGIRLLVPASLARQALELLEDSALSDEELAAQAEAAVPSDEDAELLR